MPTPTRNPAGPDAARRGGRQAGRARVRRLPAAILAALLLGLPAAHMPSPAAAQAPASVVQVDPVVREPMGQTSPVIGRIVARQVAVVAATVGGPVGAVLVEVGDRVVQGETLVSLDLTRMQAELTRREAELRERGARLEAARAARQLAQADLDRLAALRQSAAFTQQRFDAASAEVSRSRGAEAEAEALLSSARVNLSMTELDLASAQIRAPFSGVVARRHTELGEYLREGDPVVTLVNDTDLEIEAAVPGTLRDALQPGTPVRFRLDDGSEHDALLRAVVPQEDPQTRTRLVRFVPMFEGPQLPLADGQSVMVLVPASAQRDVVTVHKDALVTTTTGQQVFVVDGGIAQERMIRIGDAVGPRFEVLDGLQPGEVVVVRGNERLSSGQSVRF